MSGRGVRLGGMKMCTIQIGTCTLTLEQAEAHMLAARARRASLEAGRARRKPACTECGGPLTVCRGCAGVVVVSDGTYEPMQPMHGAK